MPFVVFFVIQRGTGKFEKNSLDLERAQGCIVMTGAVEREPSKGAEQDESDISQWKPP